MGAGLSVAALADVGVGTIVDDDPPPVLTVPETITTSTQSLNGTTVTYSVSATDQEDPYTVVSCKTQLTLGLSSPEHFVFCSAKGKPLDRHNVRNKGIITAALKAGLHGDGQQTVTTHDLRRTFISHLIVGLGLDPVRVKNIVGHSNVSVTLNTYADEFDKAMHRNDLMARIAETGFGAV